MPLPFARLPVHRSILSLPSPALIQRVRRFSPMVAEARASARGARLTLDPFHDMGETLARAIVRQHASEAVAVAVLARGDA